MYFFNKLRQIQKTTKELLPFLGLVFFFPSNGISHLIVSFFDYFRWSSIEFFFNPDAGPFLLYKIYITLTELSNAFLIFIFEYTLKKTKYILTIYMILGVILQIFSSSVSESFQVGIPFVPISVFACIMWYFVFIKPVPKNLKKPMIIALIGVCLALPGLLARAVAFNYTTRVVYCIGTIIAIVSMCLFAYGFSKLKAFSDLNWKQKLRELFIISNINGISLYAYSFDQNKTIEDSETNLIAGGFQGIQAFLSEIVKTKESLQLIDYKNLKVMLEKGIEATFILILKQESLVSRYKIKLLSNEFHNFFKDIFQNWQGNVSLFLPTKALIQKIFEIE